MCADRLVKYNMRAHDAICDKYEQMHGEIFNPIEQKRLRNCLKKATEYIKTSSIRPLKALDYGCGSGNITKHLINLGFRVVSTDVSANFLAHIRKKFNDGERLETLKINGVDLSNIKKDTFDFVATYSVLHHVPNYLQIIEEFVRVTKPGGIIYIDHEVNDTYWNRNKEYVKFLRLSVPKRSQRLVSKWYGCIWKISTNIESQVSCRRGYTCMVR